MKGYGKVSVVTPAYNCEELIGATIESVMAQTYEDWELLITDDCSTDGTREVVERYARMDSRIKLLRLEANGGAGVARNNSIRAAQGRFIAFCDSDDRWAPQKLERQLQFMVEGGYALTYTSYMVSDEQQRVCGYVECLPWLNYARILRDNGIGCLTAIYDREAMGRFEMPSWRHRQDWCLWIDIIRHVGRAYGLQEPLAIYTVRSGSMSRNKVSMLRWNYRVYHRFLGFNAVRAALQLGGCFLPYYFYKKVKQRCEYKLRLKKQTIC
jgi:glycosyltransferase involved in cell wall biosynthesis